MDCNVIKYIDELDQYIDSGKNRLQKILTTLDWTIEDSLKEINGSMRKGGDKSFNKNDPFLPESFGSVNSVVIDKPQLQFILNRNNVSIPEKFSDIQLNFTRAQKVKLYDYVISNTAKTSEPELKVSFPNDDTDYDMTFAEIVAKAKKKDKKLQRKYRTSKPTHIEEVRNLVHLQMQALEKYFNPDSEAQHSNLKDQDKKSRRSRERDKLEQVRDKLRNRSSDGAVQNQSSEIRNRIAIHHQNRSSDKRRDTKRSQSREKGNRFSGRKSPRMKKRKHSSDKGSGGKDDALLDKSKKKHSRSKSLKNKKKHKHHRKHSTTDN